MNGYEQLRELLCKEEEIRKDLELTSLYYGNYDGFELRHILWYIQIKYKNALYCHEIQDLINDINFSLPLSSQEEVCKKIYDYLITL